MSDWWIVPALWAGAFGAGLGALAAAWFVRKAFASVFLGRGNE